MGLQVDANIVFEFVIMLLEGQIGEAQFYELDLGVFISLKGDAVCMFLLVFNDENSIEGVNAGSKRLKNSHFVTDLLELVA